MASSDIYSNNYIQVTYYSCYLYGYSWSILPLKLGLPAEVSAAPWPLRILYGPSPGSAQAIACATGPTVSDWDDDAGDKRQVWEIVSWGIFPGWDYPDPIFWTLIISDHFHATSKRPCEVVSHIFEETPPNQSSWIPQLRGGVRFRFLIATVTWFILDALRKRLCLGYWNMSVQIRNIQITMKHTWVIMNLNCGFPTM